MPKKYKANSHELYISTGNDGRVIGSITTVGRRGADRLNNGAATLLGSDRGVYMTLERLVHILQDQGVELPEGLRDRD